MSGYRLAQGGLVDRSQPLAFTFDGKVYQGFAGDTLASALLASGVSVFGRSFKYHRKRGLMTAGPEEPSALVRLMRGDMVEPNLKATEVELFEGLKAESQNRWPSLSFDVMAVNSLAGPMLSAGFYYKTFMWPKSFWERVYEPMIRRAAGLGRAEARPDADHYDATHNHCDVLVVGSGAAGLAAARAAAEAGARVILCERDAQLGNALMCDKDHASWRAGMLSAITATGNVKILTRTNVFGFYDHGMLGGTERRSDHLAQPQPYGVRQRYHTFRAKRVVLATGATERIIAFPGNDRPGVMLAGAALTYLRRYGVVAGRRAVVFTNNDTAYETASALVGAGLETVTVVDCRPSDTIRAMERREGVEILAAAQVTNYSGRSVTVRLANGDSRKLSADLLCVSGGWNANVQLASQAGAKLAWNPEALCYIAETAGQNERTTGAARGLWGTGSAAHDGLAQGLAAAGDLGFAAATNFPLPEQERAPAAPMPLWEVEASGKSFVDLQHDVTADDIRLAHREGFRHVEHAKRYTTHGMATDQGAIGGLVGSAILAKARGEPVQSVGLPTFRPYTQPVTIGTIAGHHVGKNFQPVRRTALHDWHVRNGGVMQPTGLWMRPFYYPKAGESGWDPIFREARAVRSRVGLCDVSTLGKIDVQGRDAAAFLDRLYTNTFSKLAIGRTRYGLMLREDGLVFDDGTTTRLGENHFLMTTTTANAAPVLQHMEYFAQVVWPELDVQFCSVTDQWAQFSLAGPLSRDVLSAVLSQVDLSNEAFPFMAAGEAIIDGIPGRIFRISFSGEMAYEIAVPSAFGERVWEKIMTAGAPHGIVPYGLEALSLMRVEKGHPAGPELNGHTTAIDLGLGGMLKKKGDYVGKALATRPALSDPSRPRLVGLHPVNQEARLRGGAHLVSPEDRSRSLGWVTSVTRSVELGHWIGMAMLADGVERHGQTLLAVSPLHDEAVDVRITPPCHVDPENRRVHG